MKNRLHTKNDVTPAFFEKLTTAVGESWKSMGSICCKLNELSDGYYEAMFFPALREIYGGKTDGDVVFPGFHFNVGKFVKLFDKSPAPKVSFDSLRQDFVPHLMFRGYVDGTCLKIIIMEHPPCGEEAVERAYVTGPKNGQVEIK